MEDDKFKLEGSTWEQFFKAREKAEKEGTLDEFNQQLIAQMGPALQQLMAVEQEG